jgi:hypothetical protein
VHDVFGQRSGANPKSAERAVLYVLGASLTGRPGKGCPFCDYTGMVSEKATRPCPYCFGRRGGICPDCGGAGRAAHLIRGLLLSLVRTSAVCPPRLASSEVRQAAPPTGAVVTTHG